MLKNIQNKTVTPLTIPEQTKVQKAIAKNDDFEDFCEKRGIAINVAIPIKKIAILDEIEMMGRRQVDKLYMKYQYLLTSSIVVCYWRSKNIFIHIDGWHRMEVATRRKEKTLQANIIDFEYQEGRPLSYEEIRERCCDIFLSQKEGCANLKAIDCYYPEKYCSNEKRRAAAWAIDAVEQAGFEFITKGENKDTALSKGKLNYTLFREIANQFPFAFVTVFVAEVVSTMASAGNTETRTMKKLLNILEDNHLLTPEFLEANQSKLISVLAGKTVIEYVNDGKNQTDKALQDKAANMLYNFLVA